MANKYQGIEKETPDIIRNERQLTGLWRWVVIVLSLIGLVLIVNQIFSLGIFNIVLLNNIFLYLLLAIYFSIVFLIFPLKKDSKVVFWIDCTLFLVSFFTFSYFAYNGYNIQTKGWEIVPPQHFIYLSIIVWVLIVESVRRTVGYLMASIIVLISIYPVYAGYMPGVFRALSRTFPKTAVYYALSGEGILGVSLRVTGDTLIGFMIFGTVLSYIGGGDFFIKVAFAVLGKAKGAAGKAAVISSALMGTLNGSVMSNVITSGSITIPAMKKTGYSSTTAAAIELCASTGGVIMPPVMGAVAFIMAAFIGVPYVTIIKAALIPSLLYYLGLYVQVHSYAMIHNIQSGDFVGDDYKLSIRKLFSILKEGWIFIFSLAFLIYYLLATRVVSRAPYFTILILLVFIMLGKNRLKLKNVWELLYSIGQSLSEIISIVAAIGMILGALYFTGVGPVISREILHYAGDNVALLLILGAVASFIMGMGLAVVASYIFLAIILAPALTPLGYNIIAVHFFILYWANISYITPPVALGAYPAASIAKANSLNVAFEATRMGGVIYLIPFLFVFEPALVFQAEIGAVLYAFMWAVLGVILMSCSMSGYLYKVGRLHFGNSLSNRIMEYLSRFIILAGGFSMALPYFQAKIIGVVLAVIVIVFANFKTKAIYALANNSVNDSN
ncbi:MAG: TRAP transporter fused permease subunit [Dethiobacter sp.]|nr:TRAP transporter fused permease subunit [Dethiobacter sp.]